MGIEGQRNAIPRSESTATLHSFGTLVRLVLGLVSFKGSRLLVQKGQLCILHAYCGGGGVGGEMGGKITFDLQDFA